MAIQSESLRCPLPDGATLAYDIFGLEHLGKDVRLPLVLIGGMSNIKIDWARLAPSLSQNRPVLVYDHRGIGESTYSTPDNNDEITIEMMARDLVVLIQHVGWKNVDILGFSMGGVVLQQLLLLPTHSTNATPLPFGVHHALLTGTLSAPLEAALPAASPLAPGQQLTDEEKKARIRPMLHASLGPKWVVQPENKARYELWLERAINGRPMQTIMKQRAALSKFNFTKQLVDIPSTTKVLVIHGREDLVVPFSYGEEILRSLPHAQSAEIGSQRGQVPNYDFGHLWYEYFEVDVWVGVIEVFVDEEGSARL